jgi:hypothetical protein
VNIHFFSRQIQWRQEWEQWGRGSIASASWFYNSPQSYSIARGAVDQRDIRYHGGFVGATSGSWSWPVAMSHSWTAESAYFQHRLEGG